MTTPTTAPVEPTKRKTAVDCHRVDFGSAEQTATVKLRDDVLRKPLGMSIYDEPLHLESEQWHFAAMATVGEKSEKVVAACLILLPSTEHTDHVKLRQMAVADAFQGQGVGRALLTYAEDYARERGFTLIYAAARETALDFYRALGWSVVSERFTEVTIPHFKMEKVLLVKNSE
jgi:GNAT superfamily N-acetyltransferase